MRLAVAATRIALAWLLALTAPAGSADAESLRIDPAASQASFRIPLRFLPDTQGHFAGVSGELQSDGGSHQRVLVTLDGRSLSVDGPGWMEHATRSEDFLDVEHFPEISFRSDAFAPELLRVGGELHGLLTLRGVQRPVAFRLLPSICVAPGRDCSIRVLGSIRRRDFGMSSDRLLVKDEVDFDIQVRLLERSRP
jgi:polyisoprenoid-binding protein YceI